MQHPCSIHWASNPCNRSLVAGASMESGTARSLRALRQRSTSPVTVEAPHPKKTTETEIKELRERAWALGYVLQDVKQWDKMVANAIGLRLSRRHGEDIYQCGAIKLFGIPQRAVTHWAPPPTTINGSELLWSFDSAFEVSNAFAPMLKNSRYVTAGATRALQTPSEPVFRLVATMMGGVEMRHVTHPDGDWWSCNFQYILMDDMGEMHPPKDANRSLGSFALPSELDEDEEHEADERWVPLSKVRPVPKKRKVQRTSLLSPEEPRNLSSCLNGKSRLPDMGAVERTGSRASQSSESSRTAGTVRLMGNHARRWRAERQRCGLCKVLTAVEQGQDLFYMLRAMMASLSSFLPAFFAVLLNSVLPSKLENNGVVD